MPLFGHIGDGTGPFLGLARGNSCLLVWHFAVKNCCVVALLLQTVVRLSSLCYKRRLPPRPVGREAHVHRGSLPTWLLPVPSVWTGLASCVAVTLPKPPRRVSQLARLRLLAPCGHCTVRCGVGLSCSSGSAGTGGCPLSRHPHRAASAPPTLPPRFRKLLGPECDRSG